MNFVLVGSDEFEKNSGRWCWVGYDRVNAQICWWKKHCAAVDAKYGWLFR